MTSKLKVAEFGEMVQFGIESASINQPRLIAAIEQQQELATQQLENGTDDGAQDESEGQEAKTSSGDDEENGVDTSSLDISAGADDSAKNQPPFLS